MRIKEGKSSSKTFKTITIVEMKTTVVERFNETYSKTKLSQKSNAKKKTTNKLTAKRNEPEKKRGWFLWFFQLAFQLIRIFSSFF